MKIRKILIFYLVSILVLCSCDIAVLAHPGKTDSKGGHYDRKTGKYHYHNNGQDQNTNSSNGSSNTQFYEYASPTPTPKPYINVVSPPKSIKYGQSFSPEIEHDESASGYTLTSSNPNVITVNGDLLEAKGVGASTITVRSKNTSSSFDLIVEGIYPSSLEVEDVVIFVNDTAQTAVKILPENVTETIITWSSYDPNIAKISDTGLIKGIKSGNTTMLATTQNGIECKFNITVKDVLPESISFNKEETIIEIDKKDQLIYNILPKNATNKLVKYTVKDKKIVSVNEYGNVSPLAEGKTEIEVTTINGKKDTVQVTVFEIHPTSLTFNVDKLSEFEIFGCRIAFIHNEYEISTIVTPDNITYDKVQYVFTMW